MAMTIQEFRDYYERLKKEPFADCELCKEPIMRGDSWTSIQDGKIHTGCYYEMIGDMIERHPIVSPRTGYGCMGDD